jgi:IS4 transposase
MAYDGNLPCLAEIFTTKEYLTEDLTIPKVVYKYANKDNKAIFVFDRGVQKRDVFCKLSKQDTGFVTRLKERSRYKVINEIEDGKNRPIGKLELISDQKIQLLKPGTKKLLKEPFRLIIAINPNTKVTYYFLTNLFEISVEEILSHYKKRWDIEVFFRFIKQELNFSHITSTSENGIAVMMYMTLITAMMVLVYKKLNEVGYKTAVRRISLELNEMIIKMIVVHCGGDPSLVFR